MMTDGSLEGTKFLYGAEADAGISPRVSIERFLLGCHHEQVMMDTAVEGAELA